MKRIYIFVLLMVLTSLFSACVPQTKNNAYQVVVINAPTESRVTGLAEQFEKSLVSYGYNGFTDSSIVRFIERNREMHGYRAVLASTQLARTVGAEYAVYIGAPVFEREIKEVKLMGKLTKSLHISTRLQLEAVIVDPANGEVVSKHTSKVYLGERFVPIDSKVPSKDADPDIQIMIKMALEDISPAVAVELNKLRNNYYVTSVDTDTSDYIPSR